MCIPNDIHVICRPTMQFRSVIDLPLLLSAKSHLLKTIRLEHVLVRSISKACNQWEARAATRKCD